MRTQIYFFQDPKTEIKQGYLVAMIYYRDN